METVSSGVLLPERKIKRLLTLSFYEINLSLKDTTFTIREKTYGITFSILYKRVVMKRNSNKGASKKKHQRP